MYEFIVTEYGKTKKLEDCQGILMLIDVDDGVKIRKPTSSFVGMISFKAGCDRIQKLEACLDITNK